MKNILTKTNLLVAGGLLLLMVMVAVVMNFANNTTDVVDSEAKNKTKVVTAQEKKDAGKVENKVEGKEEKATEAEAQEKEEKAVEEAKNTKVEVPKGEKATPVKPDSAPQSNEKAKENQTKNNDNVEETPTEVIDPGPGTADNPVELEIVEVDVVE